VFAVIAFGTVRRLSAAYDVARSWGISAAPTDELARPFVRTVFLVGAPSLILALAAATVAVLSFRARRQAGVAAAVVGGLAAVPLLVGLAIGLASDRAPGRWQSRPAMGSPSPFVDLLNGYIQFNQESGWASPADELTSRLLSMSTMDTIGQVVGLLAVGFILAAVVAHRRDRSVERDAG
jgi:hypothetical protein